VKLDVAFFNDDRIVELSPEAQLLYIRTLCLCQTLESDGVFTAAQLRATGAKLGSAREPLRYLAELTAGPRDDDSRPTPDARSGDTLPTPALHLSHARQASWSALVAQLDDRSYRISAWLKHNKSAAEIREIRGKRAKAGQAGGKASADNRAEQAKQNPCNLLGECQATVEASESSSKAESSSSSSSASFAAIASAPDSGRDDDDFLRRVVDLIAKTRTEIAQVRGKEILSPVKYAEKTARGIWANEFQLVEKFRQCHKEHPTWAESEVADGKGPGDPDKVWGYDAFGNTIMEDRSWLDAEGNRHDKDEAPYVRVAVGVGIG